MILFTSGRTRHPKGFVHSLNTVTAGANKMARITGADEHGVLFLVSPAMSSAGITQMHPDRGIHKSVRLPPGHDDD